MEGGESTGNQFRLKTPPRACSPRSGTAPDPREPSLSNLLFAARGARGRPAAASRVPRDNAPEVDGPELAEHRPHALVEALARAARALPVAHHARRAAVPCALQRVEARIRHVRAARPAHAAAAEVVAGRRIGRARAVVVGGLRVHHAALRAREARAAARAVHSSVRRRGRARAVRGRGSGPGRRRERARNARKCRRRARRFGEGRRNRRADEAAATGAAKAMAASVRLWLAAWVLLRVQAIPLQLRAVRWQAADRPLEARSSQRPDPLPRPPAPLLDPAGPFGLRSSCHWRTSKGSTRSSGPWPRVRPREEEEEGTIEPEVTRTRPPRRALSQAPFGATA